MELTPRRLNLINDAYDKACRKYKLQPITKDEALSDFYLRVLNTNIDWHNSGVSNFLVTLARFVINDHLAKLYKLLSHEQQEPLTESEFYLDHTVNDSWRESFLMVETIIDFETLVRSSNLTDKMKLTLDGLLSGELQKETSQRLRINHKTYEHRIYTLREKLNRNSL